MKTRWVIPAATVSAAILWPANAHAITWTCYANTSWAMEQPDADWDAGLRPTWTDCEAWRGGNPGPQYVWSYGPSAATTTSVPATTTTEPATTTSSTTTTSTTSTTSTTTTTTTTTVPAPANTTTTATVQTSTTTTTSASVSPTTTTSVYQLATSTTQDNTTQTIATSANTTSTSSSTTLLPVDPTPETIPTTTIVQTDTRATRAAKIIGAQLAPGVTPLQAQTVLVVNVAMQAVSVATARKHNEK